MPTFTVHAITTRSVVLKLKKKLPCGLAFLFTHGPSYISTLNLVQHRKELSLVLTMFNIKYYVY